jgi:2-dehydropantoate 2-reductase
MRVAVAGAGAVGGLLGARLQAAGHDVWFLARGATCAHLAAHGLTIDSCDGNLRLPSVQVTSDPAVIGAVDLLLVAVKATQVAALAPTLRPLVGAATAVIPMQNGVEAGAQLADALGAGHVLEGVCRVIASLAAPGHVTHTAVTPVVEFGPRAGASLDPAVAEQLPPVAEAIRAAGMVAVQPDDMAIASWEKFLFIEPMGVVCAAAREPFGTVRSTPELRALVDSALDEVMAVGTAMGVQWRTDAKQGVWARYDGLPADSTTSLARDLMNGRPSEFDAQTGAVVRLARTHGVSTPVHQVLHALLVPSARNAD